MHFYLIFILLFAFNAPALAGGGGFNWDSTPNAKFLPPFYKINCSDNITVRLAGTQKAASLAITHRPENTLLVSEVSDDTLYLSVTKQEEKKPIGLEPMKISLKSGPLQQIVVSGNCKIDGSKIETYGLELIGQEGGQINLKGNNIKISKIIAEGQSCIKVLWANSRRLYINTFDESAVKIAGSANEILLKAFGSSEIDAQYLRTCYVNVATYEEGFAEVFPLYGMRAFAQDRGRVDYYTVPDNAISITQFSGNVLWMGYRN